VVTIVGEPSLSWYPSGSPTSFARALSLGTFRLNDCECKSYSFRLTTTQMQVVDPDLGPAVGCPAVLEMTRFTVQIQRVFLSGVELFFSILRFGLIPSISVPSLPSPLSVPTFLGPSEGSCTQYGSRCQIIHSCRPRRTIIRLNDRSYPRSKRRRCVFDCTSLQRIKSPVFKSTSL